eukprot:Skav210675  [mRNA]  locus=scaffold5572:31742:33130:- [translate_table: standard]
MARINDIKQRLLSVGGTAADWNMMLSSGLGLSDLFWNNGEKEKDKSQDLARDMMVKGNFVEYQCYQSNGALQGKAIIQLKAWENFDEGILTADHVVASDPYYEWYGSHDLSGGQAVYHVCRSKHTQCRCRLPRGDRRVIVHMDRWRCVNPSVMLENGYSTTKALEILEKMVKDFQPRVPEPAAPPQTAQHGPPVGGDATGVDRALDQLGVARGVEAPEKGGSDPPGEGKVKGVPRGSVGAVLMKRAEAQRVALVEKQRKDKDRGRSRSRRRKKDRDRRRSSSSGRSVRSRSRSSGSDAGFRLPSTGGEDGLWRLSQKSPGKLLKSGMLELSRYLATRAGEGGEETSWADHRVMAYVTQVVLTQHPPSQIGVRNHREVVTLGQALDLLLLGDLPRLGDLLMQRLKAVETALAEGSWQAARHQELIPPAAASLTTEAERKRAAKTELNALKLKEMVAKGKHPKK